jgi:hypothetical protein
VQLEDIPPSMPLFSAATLQAPKALESSLTSTAKGLVDRKDVRESLRYEGYTDKHNKR